MGVTLTAGADRAVVDPDRGGRLASLVAGGTERLVTTAPPDATDPVLAWGCYLMAPWAGRLAGAVLPWRGERHDLTANEAPHALHGVVFDERWTVGDAGGDSVTLSCALPPERWPLGGTVRQRVRLSPGALTLEASVEAGPRGMPAAVGWHPWFRRPAAGDMAVSLDADTTLITTGDLVPTGATRPVTGEEDLRGGPLLGDRRLDHPYAGVRPPAAVRWPDLELTMDFGTPIATVVVHTPPAGVCVEPQSAWPNAAVLAAAGVEGTGVAPLGPGGRLSARVEWRWGAPEGRQGVRST